MFKIVKAEQLSANVYKKVVLAPRVAASCQPGQFIIVRLDETGERIPLTICDYDREAGTITIVFQPIGVSTSKMVDLKEGDYFLDFVGPLGRPSELVTDDFEEVKKKKVIFIAGGVGTAPVYPQAKWLHDHGVECDIIIGARSKDILIMEEEMSKVGNLYLCTDDGSYGFKGVGTAMLEKLVSEGHHYDLCVAIGPMIMMKFACLTTKKLGIPTIVSMNPIMVDGTGMCGACRVVVGLSLIHILSQGPAVTRYELQPDQGVKVNKIVSLADDIKLNLAVTDVRIEAPIPGKAAVGIEVPNAENSIVSFRELVSSQEFKNHKSKLAFAVGKDIAGKIMVTDIAKMPHLLIAGATGSGKSVCINTLIMSLLYKSSPDEVKLIMIDPKVVELSTYNGIPHLLIPVVTDPKKAAGALNWAVAEMTHRYKLFADYNVRNLAGYNEKIKNIEHIEDDTKPQKLPQIVIVVDELADLMMVAPGEVEDAICRLAQLARAAGIHLIIATQRPSVNVITGLIKANMPSRIAFAVSSGVDSRTILDMNGAEKLLGKGDMLFYPYGYPKPVRVQGAFVSDEEDVYKRQQ